MVDLKDDLVAHGVANLAGWTLVDALAVSADGRTIVGYGANPLGNLEAWIATVLGPGDANGDGVVDVFDVNLVSSHWGETGPLGDVNGDLMVDIFDINMISANWTSTGGAAAVPEPKALVLAVLAAACCATWASRRNNLYKSA